MKYFCNPLNVEYHYQFMKPMMGEGVQVAREAADPSMILFKGRYYIFASMTLEVWVSDDMVSWESHRLPQNLPLYDYAPDVRVLGDYVYFSASKRGQNCNFYRTKDIINGPYEEIPGNFDFWDPNLFIDEDGRVYFYWGCSNVTPIWGVELDPKTMRPTGERKELIFGDALVKGYERIGEDHSELPRSEEEVEGMLQAMLRERGIQEKDVPPETLPLAKGMFSNKPYIEGAWMDKYQGRYYLQYACTGAEYNVYADGVYVSDSPLGPFELAANNPYSYKPGGFLPGAGHGSTMRDLQGNLWHAATMRISVNHPFERRVGIWPAGFDMDGELFCNQRYGDWPLSVEQTKINPWRNPDWYLLSYGKEVKASSFEEGKGPELAADENVRTWWRAGEGDEQPWISIDLRHTCRIHAVQVNFADDKIDIPVPGEFQGDPLQQRYIDDKNMVTRWKLEGSLDGKEYFILKDKSEAGTNLPHDLVVKEAGVSLRYVRLTVLEVPYNQRPCISGLRVFGKGIGKAPEQPKNVKAVLAGDVDMEVSWKAENAMGCNVLWGHAPDKLYHSYMVFGKNSQRIGALVQGRPVYVRVDAFNEAGITEGEVQELILEKKAYV